MERQTNPKISKFYLWSVTSMMLILPLISSIIEILLFHSDVSPVAIAGKWFVLWAIGMRLLTAGIKQVMDPGFTAKQIFHIEDRASGAIVRELGFANICVGLTGVLSVFIPEWRNAAAFAGGLYMGIAGVYHIIKKPASPNEIFAMLSDLYILVLTVVYLCWSL